MTLIDKAEAHDNDLIRRGDALRVADEVFDQCENMNGDDRGAFAAAEVGARIAALAPTDAAHVNEAPKSEHDAGNVLTDAARAPAEDAHVKGETAGQVLERLGMDGVKWAAEFRTTALRLGYSDMDEGWLIGWFCNAIMAGYDRSAAQAREAALREAAMECESHADWIEKMNRQGLYSAEGCLRTSARNIIALIGEART